MTLELFHVQTQTVFELPDKLTIVLIGKTSDEQVPDIDLSDLPDSDIISRRHAQLYIQQERYFLEDLGSSNGTYLNGQPLEPHTHYPLTLGDHIELGKDSKISLIFRQKGGVASTNPSATRLQTQSTGPLTQQATLPATASRFAGLAVMALSIFILAANTRIGLFVGMPAVVLCIAGFVLLVQKRYDPNWGWGLIGLGVAIIALQGRFFATVNLLSLLMVIGLFLVGYQLFSRRPILNAIAQTIKGLLKS